MKKQRPVVSKLKTGGKKPEPLKYFRDQYEVKKKAVGGSMLEGTESTMAFADNPNKRRRKQARQQRQMRTGRGKIGCRKRKRVRIAGVWQEVCADNMA